MKRITPGKFIAVLALIPLVSNAQTPVKSDQDISFDPLPGLCATSTIQMTATASSGLPVVFYSSNPSIVHVDGNSITALAQGTVIITASQPGNEFYNPAPNVSQLLTVTSMPEVFVTDAVICSGAATNIELYSNTGGTGFTWEVLNTGGVEGASSGTGALIIQTLFNTTLLADSVTYRITPTSANCEGNPTDLIVTVNPLPEATAENQTICSGESTDIILSSTLPETNFLWVVESTTNVINATSGSGTSITQSLTNNTASAGNVIYAIIPEAAGCTGSATGITVTVNPLPSVNALSKSICSGQSTDLTLASNVPATSYSWGVQASENINGAFASAGNVIDQVLINDTVSSGYAVYAVTPAANGCTGLTTNLTVTVNPIPESTISDNTICSGQSSGLSLLANVPGTVFSWNIHEVNNVTGAFAGTGIAINQTLTNTGTTAGYATYSITPSANACAGQPVLATVTVKPSPVVLASGQTICSGATTDVNLTANIIGTEFSWELQSTLHVSGASSGSGSSIEQTLMNNSVTPGNAIYTITPAFNGCTGGLQNIIIVVNPTPAASASGQGICSGETVHIPLSSTIVGTSFMWTVQYTNNAVGAAPGSGSTISQTLSTIFPAQGDVTYRVTPQANGCTGISLDVPVTINPLASVIAVNQTICSGEEVNINLDSDIGVSGFSWVVLSALNVSGASSGSGSTITNTLTLTSSLPSFLIYLVTALNECGAGISKQVIVTVENCPPEALSFSNDYVNIPHLLLNDRLNLGTGSFVMEAYIKATVSGGVRTLLSKRTFAKGSSADGFLFGIWSDGRPFIQLGGAPNILPPVSAGNLYDGSCHHVAVKRDGTTISFFIDGVFVGTGNASSARSISTAGALRIAADPASNSNFFGGWIGEVRLWNMALNDAQIAENMQSELQPQEGLMGYYDMKDSGQVLTDLSTVLNKNNGILGNSSLSDGFDPAWLMSSMITCSPGQNFRMGELPEEIVDMPDSVNLEQISAGIEAYPVPADESVTIAFTDTTFAGTIVTISDTNGSPVVNAIFEENETTKTLDTSSLPNGVYVVQLEVMPGVIVRKKISVAHP